MRVVFIFQVKILSIFRTWAKFSYRWSRRATGSLSLQCSLRLVPPAGDGLEADAAGGAAAGPAAPRLNGLVEELSLDPVVCDRVGNWIGGRALAFAVFDLLKGLVSGVMGGFEGPRLKGLVLFEVFIARLYGS